MNKVCSMKGSWSSHSPCHGGMNLFYLLFVVTGNYIYVACKGENPRTHVGHQLVAKFVCVLVALDARH